MINVSWIFMMKSIDRNRIDIISKARNHIDSEREFRDGMTSKSLKN